MFKKYYSYYLIYTTTNISTFKILQTITFVNVRHSYVIFNIIGRRKRKKGNGAIDLNGENDLFRWTLINTNLVALGEAITSG